MPVVNVKGAAPLATEKQVAFYVKLGGDAAEIQSMTVAQASAAITAKKEEAWAAKAAAKQEAMAMVPGAPKGDVTIQGVVVSTKMTDNPYWGPQAKFLVEMDDGNRVYGTIPAAIRKGFYSQGAYDGLKGARVEISATFKRSDGDPHFSVFSHPKGKVVQVAA